jgi:hypothetical protein
LSSEKLRGITDFINTCQKIKSECCQAYGASEWLPTTEGNLLPLEDASPSFQRAVEFVKVQQQQQRSH